jgi:hypothetical protein
MKEDTVMSDNQADLKKPDDHAEPDRGVLKCTENGKGYYIHADGRVEEINDIHFLKRLAWLPNDPTTHEKVDE